MLKNKIIKIFLLLFTSTMLSGCLQTMFVGAAGTMVEIAKERPVGDAITDVRISTAIKAALMKKNFRNLYVKIKIEVIQGRVLFTGVVNNEEDSINAVKIAWEQEGVNKVINELKVDKDSNNFNLFQYTKDTMITSHLRSKIFMNRDIKFINYTVITHNNIVYLFGIARSSQELEKVANIASNLSGVSKVVSHVTVQEGNQNDIANKKLNAKKDFIIDQDIDDLNLDDLNLDEGIDSDW